jgi:hypothetical protein
MLYGMKRPCHEEHRRERSNQENNNSVRRREKETGARSKEDALRETERKYLIAAQKGNYKMMLDVSDEYHQMGGSSFDLANARDHNGRTVTMNVARSCWLWVGRKEEIYLTAMANRQNFLHVDVNGQNELHNIINVSSKQSSTDKRSSYAACRAEMHVENIWHLFDDLRGQDGSLVRDELINQSDMYGNRPIDLAYKYGNEFGVRMLEHDWGCEPRRREASVRSKNRVTPTSEDRRKK